MYIHTYIHIYVCRYTHMHLCVYIHTSTNACIYAYICTCMCVEIQYLADIENNQFFFYYIECYICCMSDDH